MLRVLLLSSLISFSAYAGDSIVVSSGDRQTAVVELYTSEGCSSCPPADRWLSRLIETPKDELGANNLQRTIYTPEFFVNGMEARGAANILDKIQQANQQQAPLELKLTVSRDETELVLELHSPGDRDTIGQIHHRYLVYENNLSTDVKRGENSGATLQHQQVVRYMSRPQNLQLNNRHRIAIESDWNPQNIGVAVLVTSPGDKQYLQALHTPVTSLMGLQ